MRTRPTAATFAATLLLAAGAAHADSVRGQGDIDAKHAYAWTEARNGKAVTHIYLFDREGIRLLRRPQALPARQD